MVEIKKASVRDAFCRKVVEKLSEKVATFDVMVKCSCRLGNVAVNEKRIEAVARLHDNFDTKEGQTYIIQNCMITLIKWKVRHT